MKSKKKKKDEFKEFRSSEKSAYKTFKIPLKTILLNKQDMQPLIQQLVYFLHKLQTTFGKDILIGYGNWSRST